MTELDASAVGKVNISDSAAAPPLAAPLAAVRARHAAAHAACDTTRALLCGTVDRKN